MKRMVPHLRIENCKEAIEFYQQVFGGEIQNAQLADEIEMFKGHEGKYIHAELHINDTCVLYFADVFDQQISNGNAILLGPDLDSEEEINKVYEALSKEGQIQMELQDTFWGAKHAIVKDRYGIIWELNYSK
ncbi:VOC family protein [Lederbergia galactosidilytica]|uniref:Glyoxalase n=1 Tax=Lederbergia galactosidilytica TaxID=217031 RepID=A0A177ZNV6_9BACI|nr:VOC family protein [Lederbergia galactosidilytica]KRG14870.1 glyoxalase [Virgibacillus soli]MBP1914549.1 PhnB protein [Lederbergia galactosidilytica]OAK69119.1 glyoxalase [Lederbergia galactosidilytica]